MQFAVLKILTQNYKKAVDKEFMEKVCTQLDYVTICFLIFLCVSLAVDYVVRIVKWHYNRKRNKMLAEIIAERAWHTRDELRAHLKQLSDGYLSGLRAHADKNGNHKEGAD